MDAWVEQADGSSVDRALALVDEPVTVKASSSADSCALESEYRINTYGNPDIQVVSAQAMADQYPEKYSRAIMEQSMGYGGSGTVVMPEWNLVFNKPGYYSVGICSSNSLDDECKDVFFVIIDPTIEINGVAYDKEKDYMYVPKGGELGYKAVVDPAESYGYEWMFEGNKGYEEQEITHAHDISTGEKKVTLKVSGKDCGMSSCGSVTKEFNVRVFDIVLVDTKNTDTATGKPLDLAVESNGTVKALGKDDEFIPEGTMQIKYRIEPQEYDSEVASSPAYLFDVEYFTIIPATGHHGLGEIDLSWELYDLNYRSKSITFPVMVIGEEQLKKKEKARHLAFEINFRFKDVKSALRKSFKTFKVEQDDRNALRSEYWVFRHVNSKDYMPSTLLPTRDDFSDIVDNQVTTVNYPNFVYSTADVPKGATVNEVVSKIPKGDDDAILHVLTSSYRNPFKNKSAGSSSAKSRHVWSDAIDIQDKTVKVDRADLKTLWTKSINTNYYGQIIVESNGEKFNDFLNGDYYKVYSNSIDFVLNSAKTYYTSGSTVYYYGAETFIMIWTTNSNWTRVIKYEWKEYKRDAAGNKISDGNGGYKTERKTGVITPKESNWGDLANVLHMQKSPYNSDWKGF